MPLPKTPTHPQVVIRRRPPAVAAPGRSERVLSGELADRVARLRPLARVEGVALDVRADDRAEEARLGDAERLLDLTTALVRSAIRFTRRGTVSVRIGGEPDGPVTLSVRFGDIREAARDDGLIWARATPVAGPSIQTLVRKFVSELGASVGLAAGPGEDSELVIVLPAGREEPGRDAAAADLEGLDILVVEQQRSLDGVASALEMQGARVVRRSDAGPAASLRFDLVLIDLDGPVDGLELLGALRRREAAAGRSPVPVAGLACEAPREEAERLFCGGFDAVKLKSAPSEDLCATIRRLTRSHRPILSLPRIALASMVQRPEGGGCAGVPGFPAIGPIGRLR
ncbi:response regulator transcription factor [Rhodobacter sp. CZR27]|uniref:response regulator transcription factor n=1 Tax=Rhodobacter sp. CZR27 TaxID=2033869 RepID=UPI000BBF0B4A|nr:response regulator transcription factor [Rhodobacter sp. CZR27]